MQVLRSNSGPEMFPGTAGLQLPRDAIRGAFKKFPTQIALVTSRGKLGYSTLQKRVSRLANGMLKMGLKKGDHIFAYLPNCAEHLEIVLAAFEIGAIFSNFDDGNKVTDLIGAARLVRPRLFVYDPKFGSAAASFFSGDLPRRQILRIGAGESYEKLIEVSPSQKINVAIGPDEPAILKFTFRSGQTPLAISFSQDSVLKSLLQVEGDNRSLPGLIKERCLLGIPMREIGTEMLLGTLVAGGMLFVSPGFSMDLILPIVAKFRITNMIITPGLLIDMLDYRGIAKFDLTCLKRVIYAGGPLPAVKLKEAIERYGAIFHQAYTLKESQQVISLLSPEDHMHSGKPASRRRLTSAGEICKAVKIKIFNGKRELEKGEIGEIAIKSSGTFSSFWKRPDLNRRFLGDGWVRTGDIGFVDPSGLLYILNRKQELIYRKKHLIYPRLVEEIVHEHPAVKEACLMEDERTGKLIMAVSLRHPWRGPWLSTAKEIKTFLAGRVEEWKMPDEILHVNELPRTYSGRGNRRKLQSMLNRRKLTQKIPTSLFDEFRPEKNQPSILAI